MFSFRNHWKQLALSIAIALAMSLVAKCGFVVAEDLPIPQTGRPVIEFPAGQNPAIIKPCPCHPTADIIYEPFVHERPTVAVPLGQNSVVPNPTIKNPAHEKSIAEIPPKWTLVEDGGKGFLQLRADANNLPSGALPRELTLVKDSNGNWVVYDKLVIRIEGQTETHRVAPTPPKIDCPPLDNAKPNPAPLGYKPIELNLDVIIKPAHEAPAAGTPARDLAKEERRQVGEMRQWEGKIIGEVPQGKVFDFRRIPPVRCVPAEGIIVVLNEEGDTVNKAMNALRAQLKILSGEASHTHPRHQIQRQKELANQAAQLYEKYEAKENKQLREARELWEHLEQILSQLRQTVVPGATASVAERVVVAPANRGNWKLHSMEKRIAELHEHAERLYRAGRTKEAKYVKRDAAELQADLDRMIAHHAGSVKCEHSHHASQPNESAAIRELRADVVELKRQVEELQGAKGRGNPSRYRTEGRFRD